MKKGLSSYFFSAYASTWGFATWKNRWSDFSLSLDQYSKDNFEQIVSPYMKKNKQKIYWINRFNIIKTEKTPLGLPIQLSYLGTPRPLHLPLPQLGH